MTDDAGNPQLTRRRMRQKLAKWLAEENERNPMSWHERLGIATFVLCVGITWSIYGSKTIEIVMTALTI